MSSPPPDTRIRILAAALDLLVAGDGRGVRMSDVARKAGVSRQALYLHFDNRADLLIEATYYLDEKLDTNARLHPSRTAGSGTERLDAFVTAWCDYLPEIYGLARALLALADTDDDAAAAWRKRMQDMREGCEAAVLALDRDGQLNPEYSTADATDLLWIMLSVRNWELAVHERGWTQPHYREMMKKSARRLLVDRDLP